MEPSQRLDRPWEPFDLRRPTKLSREQLRSLDLFHDTFSRRLSSTVGRLARASATISIVRTSQVTWEDYLRTLPAVSTLITATAPPLPGDILVEMDTSLSLALAGRLLGGSGRVEPPRRPSELEIPAISRVAAVAVDALGDALNEFIDVTISLEAVDLSPQLLALAAPSQVVLALTFALAVPMLGMAGDLTVVMSLSTLTPMLEKLVHHAERLGQDQDPSVMHAVVEQVPVLLQATLRPTAMSAASVAALAKGDVIVLDHRVGEPASVSIDSTEILRGHIGRRGTRLAVAVSEHPFDVPVAAAPLFSGPVSPAGPSPAIGPHGYPQMAHEATTFETERAT